MLIDLAAMENGGAVVGWSNMHYGHPRNLIAPGTAVNMGDGWETARRVSLKFSEYHIRIKPSGKKQRFDLSEIIFKLKKKRMKHTYISTN